jgi:hypothetical protein
MLPHRLPFSAQLLVHMAASNSSWVMAQQQQLHLQPMQQHRQRQGKALAYKYARHMSQGSSSTSSRGSSSKWCSNHALLCSLWWSTQQLQCLGTCPLPSTCSSRQSSSTSGLLQPC